MVTHRGSQHPDTDLFPGFAHREKVAGLLLVPKSSNLLPTNLNRNNLTLERTRDHCLGLDCG
jgi:hypothetical protein